MVEQLTRNEQVSGSSPLVGSTKNGLEIAICGDSGPFFLLRRIGQVCKELQHFAELYDLCMTQVIK